MKRFILRCKKCERDVSVTARRARLSIKPSRTSKGYEASFKAFTAKYSPSLDAMVKDKEQLYQLIHMLIYQIVVYSRPRNEKDIIAGRKKENQFIPNRVDIYFNLPQRLLQQLYTHQFGVRSDVLWTIQTVVGTPYLKVSPDYIKN